MTQDNLSSGEKLKRNTLEQLLRSKPVTEVDTSAGRVYLYPLRVRDITDFSKLEPGDAVSQLRAFLPCIASLALESDEAPERVPLEAAIVAALSRDEIERIAGAYIQSGVLQAIREGSQEQQAVVQETGEAVSAYLLRLLKAEVERYHHSLERMHANMPGSVRILFGQVRKSASSLGATLRDYDERVKSIKRPSPEVHPVRKDCFDEVGNILAEQARVRAEERAEEMEMVRLTGKMTAESAKTLKELAEAATAMMEQMDERDRKTNQSMREQINIAVWSLGIMVFLTLCGILQSYFAFSQDLSHNTSGAQWQVKMLAAIEQGNQRHSAAERENQELREQVKSLKSRIVALETAQRATVKEEPSEQNSD